MNPRAVFSCSLARKAYRIIWIGVLLGMGAVTARADIYQWQWINDDPSQGKEPSSTLCPDGEGVSAEPNVDIHRRNLTRAYLIGANLENAYANATVLTDADLTAANLQEARLSRATLSGTTLVGANLTGTYFSDATMVDADFSDAIVAKANFSDSDLNSTQLYSTASYQTKDLREIHLSGGFTTYKNLSGWNFTGQNLKGAIMSQATLTGADLSGANLTEARFAKSTLSGAVFTGATIACTNFSGSNFTENQLYSTTSYADYDLHGIRLSGHAMTGWNLTGQNLVDAHLGDCYLDGVDFSNTNLEGANFFRSSLINCDLTSAMVAEANFGRTNLTASQLYSTASYQIQDLHGIRFAPLSDSHSLYHDMTDWNLSDQNLTGADLAGTNLTNATVRGANLSGASFYSSILTGVDFSGAVVTEASFGEANLTKNQLYSTASYQARDLHGIHLWIDQSSGPLDWNLNNQNLTGARFEYSDLRKCTFDDALILEARFDRSRVNSRQIKSTASYQAKDLRGIGFIELELTGWDLSGQNLTGASFFFSNNLAGADLTDAYVAEARFAGTNLTASQLYSTASYKEKDLHGIAFGAGVDWTSFDMTGWDLSEQNLAGAEFYVELIGSANLTDANLAGANLMGALFGGGDLTNTNFSRADMRGATGAFLEEAVTQNTILPDGTIPGLNLTAGEKLTIRNDTRSRPISISVSSQAAFDPAASLQIVLDGLPWRSTMGFEPDVSLVSLGGKLELLLAPSVESNDLVGKTYKLFDWTETAHTGQFHIESDPRWDVSQLYTTGEISFVSEPTTPLGMGVCIIWLFAYITRSRVMDHG